MTKEQLKRRIISLAFNNDLIGLQEVVNNAVPINEISDSMGWTALHFMARYGNLEGVQFLLSKNADLNVSDRYGSTPCHHAIQFGHLDCVKLFFQHGFDFVLNKAGEYALEQCKTTRNPEIIDYVKGFMIVKNENQRLDRLIDDQEIQSQTIVF